MSDKCMGLLRLIGFIGSFYGVFVLFARLKPRQKGWGETTAEAGRGVCTLLVLNALCTIPTGAVAVFAIGFTLLYWVILRGLAGEWLPDEFGKEN